MSTSTDVDRNDKTRGLRINSFAAVVMLMFEFGLGIGVSLYASLPASGNGKGVLGAFLSAITDGPIALTLHALLGTLLVVTAIAAVVRASFVRRVPLTIIASAGLLAIVLAWLGGAKFVGSGGNGASLVMALATGLAVLCYATIVLIA
jgi:hypothetical protein